jgi:hypothetical protein
MQTNRLQNDHRLGQRLVNHKSFFIPRPFFSSKRDGEWLAPARLHEVVSAEPLQNPRGTMSRTPTKAMKGGDISLTLSMGWRYEDARQLDSQSSQKPKERFSAAKRFGTIALVD